MIAVLLTSALATAPAAPVRANPPAIRMAVPSAAPVPAARPPVRFEPVRDDKMEP